MTAGSLAFGTPWNGKHRLGNNISVPLAGICILKRGKENTIRKIPLAEAYPMVLQQVRRPADAVGFAKTMELVDLLEKNVCFYEMHCNISTDAAEMSYNFTSKGEWQMKLKDNSILKKATLDARKRKM